MKPKEYWIHDRTLATYRENCDEILKDGFVHVVEYSALAKANERIEKLREALEWYGEESLWHLHHHGGSFQAIDFIDSYIGQKTNTVASKALAADDAMKEGGEKCK